MYSPLQWRGIETKGGASQVVLSGVQLAPCIISVFKRENPQQPNNNGNNPKHTSSWGGLQSEAGRTLSLCGGGGVGPRLWGDVTLGIDLEGRGLESGHLVSGGEVFYASPYLPRVIF